MHFAYDETTTRLQRELTRFLDEEVYPAEPVLEAQLRAHPERWSPQPVLRDLQAAARARGLWNLFHPGEGGAGLSNLQYAPLAELSGRSLKLAPAAMNCAAPDTGNMAVLDQFGTLEQKERWLQPLLDGTIRSAFCMTEPDVASSDATNIRTSIRRDGDHYVVNGRKWWTTGAMNPEATIFIVMGKTDSDAARHRQQSQVLVPRNTPGVTVVRPLKVFGYDDRDHGGHAEVRFDDVRVPVANLIAKEGDGFAIAQARLGPGRIHHCMRAIGSAERALELMSERAVTRTTFGRALGDHGVVREWLAESRIAIEANRLLVLKAAWLMDTQGNKAAHSAIQAIKISVPRAVEQILSRAVQLFGAAGVSDDTPLAEMFASIRTMRIIDGPDEVHLSAYGKAQLTR
ncbi:acyl-CoA dehydrogenase family protein [Microbacterium esteraromaticum]|uniref:acyl-CoA dehydrogenase family protein n=1 Tax=Microbacterium esteraromaticum TaxID=57043 RepID=UPI001C952F52|nr:acyl-CoA dehydrogenase family protein [Microbacterium esteraromaticum]MBY6060999.1 acyl-CoA dehydrogenase family protein [Microbacterium esteraromaticum]